VSFYGISYFSILVVFTLNDQYKYLNILIILINIDFSSCIVLKYLFNLRSISEDYHEQMNKTRNIANMNFSR
jgi:hypothetical protein